MKLKEINIKNPTSFTIGIIGGGQLAKMTAQEARKLGFNVIVLDPVEECPASMVASQIVGSVNDPEKLHMLNKRCNAITYEIEQIDTKTLKENLDTEKIFPQIDILEIIQDKYIQKKFFSEKGIPVPFFKEIESVEEIKEYIPVVQKVKFGGYDGRGVVVIDKEEDLKNAIDKPSYIEELIDIEKEIAVMVVRDSKGNIKAYPVVDMIFNPDGNLLDFLVAPSDLEEKYIKEAKDLAKSAIEVLDGVGVFGVELFLDKKGRILLNEVAPRPHNSGHYTIESCETSQFEQHVRIAANLPLGSTYQMIPAITMNILGETGYKGIPIYEGLNDVMKIDGVYVHIYGKKNTFPFRKMGHITIIDNNKQRALEKAKFVKQKLKVKGDQKV